MTTAIIVWLILVHAFAPVGVVAFVRWWREEGRKLEAEGAAERLRQLEDEGADDD